MAGGRLVYIDRFPTDCPPEGNLLARFTKKTVLLVILIVILISIILRYPLVEHERHNDTFFTRPLADSILDNGYAVWTYHPLSYLGYYPISYPSGTPFLLAEISNLTGVGLSSSLLIISILSGVLFAMSVFCLSRVLLRRVDLGILATVLAVLAPRFVDSSYWTGSARAPFVALAVFTMFVAFKTGFMGQRAFIAVLGLSVIGCFMLHHMAVVFILFCLAYLLSVMTARAAVKIGSRKSLIGAKKWFAGAIGALMATTIALVAVFYLGNYGPSLEYDYASSSLFSLEPTYVSILLNMAASYTHQIGFVFPIAILSIPFYFIRTRPTALSLFPVFIIISFVPLLPSAQYITMILTPIIAVLGVTWFGIALSRKRWRRIVMVTLVALLCVSFILPVWSTNRWNTFHEASGDLVASDSQLFTDASYLRVVGEDACAISNNDVLTSKLSGVSGVVFLRSGVMAALSGDVTAESVKGNLSWMSERFPQNLYLWFEYEDESDIYYFVIRYAIQGGQFPAGTGDSWQSGEDYFERHSRLLVVVDNRWPSNYMWVWSTLPAKLPTELRNAEWKAGSTTFPLESYSLYVSERITLYATEVPNRYA